MLTKTFIKFLEVHYFGRKMTIKMYLEENLHIFKTCFELLLTRATNVRKQVLLTSCYILLSWWLGGWSEMELKTNPVQFQLKL